MSIEPRTVDPRKKFLTGQASPAKLRILYPYVLRVVVVRVLTAVTVGVIMVGLIQGGPKVYIRSYK